MDIKNPLTSFSSLVSDELTKEEKEAYERLQLKAQKGIEELKNANEYP